MRSHQAYFAAERKGYFEFERIAKFNFKQPQSSVSTHVLYAMRATECRFSTSFGWPVLPKELVALKSDKLLGNRWAAGALPALETAEKHRRPNGHYKGLHT